MSNDPLRERVLEYLAGHHVMTLATVGPAGPWAAAVFYASAGFDLYFLSAGHTRHAQELAAQPRAAAAIQEDYREWAEIKGIQLEGLVGRLEGAEREAAVAVYGRKFPFIEREPALLAALARVNWYRLRPERLCFVDNSRGFGHREELIVNGEW